MSVRYSVQFYDVLTQPDGSGWITEPVVTLAAEGSHVFSFTNDHDLLGKALMVRTHGKPLVAVVTIKADCLPDKGLERRYFIGNPGIVVAVTFGGIMGDCQPFPLHSYEDDLYLYDLGRNTQ